MRVALLAPLPPARTGIADYAGHWRDALQACGVQVFTPLEGVLDADIERALARFDWRDVDLAHAELGGGRGREFLALEYLHRQRPQLPLSATVHDPERLIWRAPSRRGVTGRLPRPLPQLLSLLDDPRTLARERRLAHSLRGAVTLTALGAAGLRRRMRLPAERVQVIPHGNPALACQPPPAAPLRLLYFGFIYPGKGIEDLLDALARARAAAPALREQLRVTLAGGSAPLLAFGHDRNYLRELRARAARLDLDHALDWQLDLPAEAIPALILRHHAMVLPYREPRRLRLLGQMRGTSGALSWAAACARGAIVSDARAFAEEVSAGNGCVYPAGDVDALAERLLAVARAPQLVNDWSAQAARIGRERRWSDIAARFRDWFAYLCGGHLDVR